MSAKLYALDYKKTAPITTHGQTVAVAVWVHFANVQAARARAAIRKAEALRPGRAVRARLLGGQLERGLQ